MKSFILTTSVVLTALACRSFALPYSEQEDEGSFTNRVLAEQNLLQNQDTSIHAQQISILSWEESYSKAKLLVDQMSLEQKVNITTGIGWEAGPCVGNSGRTMAPDFPELCLQDSPLGMRFADGVSSGVAGINAAASFDRVAIRKRGEYMGEEFRAKGAHAQLGPSMNMLRAPEGGRNWEAFGEDPFLVGVASAETIKGIQSQGVVSSMQFHIVI
jgi:beta-glucosidase